MEISETIHQTRLTLTAMQYEQWRGILFSAQWWSLLALLAFSWAGWWKLVDRRRCPEVLSYALLICALGTTLDGIGVKLGLWAYPIKLLYLNSGLIAGDWGLPPVVKALVYQHYPDWKGYLTGQLAVTAFFSFIGEPILVWMGVYRMPNWCYVQSFAIYFIVAVVAKWILDAVGRRARPLRQQPVDQCRQRSGIH